ncbi:hypothetical protein [Janthinobacterium sp. LB3P118]|uniref:hypothetical protein n=1 Tax=Janthinobacterium sp. LB3P118 TaxID=3424195 RepID=UPI003F24413F
MEGNVLRTGEEIEDRTRLRWAGIVEIADGRRIVVDATDAAEHRANVTDLRVRLVEPFLGAAQSAAKVKVRNSFSVIRLRRTAPPIAYRA